MSKKRITFAGVRRQSFIIRALWRGMVTVLCAFLLTSCTSKLEAERMRHDMEIAEAQNKAYQPFTTDSVALALTRYFDRHGTANERMKAHYLLGCAYRDLGEAPRAIDCYHDALRAADTTAIDCDYLTMSSVYSQMASVYHKQLLLSYEIDARKKDIYYSLLGKDTLNAINSMKQSAGAYILLNKNDSAEIIIKKALNHNES